MLCPFLILMPIVVSISISHQKLKIYNVSKYSKKKVPDLLLVCQIGDLWRSCNLEMFMSIFWAFAGLYHFCKGLLCRNTSISWKKWTKLTFFLICFFPESDWRPCESILGAISKCLLSRQTSFHEKNERMLEFTLSPNDHDP